MNELPESKIPDDSDVGTCPKCGALAAPQATQCRRCGKYLQGMSLDGHMFSLLVPKPFASAPATALLCFIIVGWYLMLALVTAGDSLAVVSGYTARIFGSLDSSWVWFGEYWRTLSSVFLHHDLLHLAFNIYALRIAGPIFERLFDSRRLIVLFVVCGAVSMSCSYLWSQLGLFGDPAYHQSLGASGGISAVIGANLVAARRAGYEEQETFKRMLTWIALILLIGLGFGGGRLDNAAHIGGLIAGAVFALLVSMPTRPPGDRGWIERIGWSLAMYASLIVSIAILALAVANIAGLPTHLERDGYPRSMMFFKISDGAPWELSDQNRVHQRCSRAVFDEDGVTEESFRACRQDVLTNAHDYRPWMMYAEMLKRRGDLGESARAVQVGERLRKSY